MNEEGSGVVNFSFLEILKNFSQFIQKWMSYDTHTKSWVTTLILYCVNLPILMLPTFFACVFLFPTQNAYYTFGILLGVNFVTSIIGTLSYSIFPDLEKISKGIFGLYSLLGMYLAIALVFFTPQNEYSANYKQIFESGQCEKLDSGLLNTSREYCINLHKEAEDKAGKYVIISIVNILNTDNSLGCRVKFVRDSVMGYGLSFTESDLKISCDTLKIGDKRSLILKPKTNKSLIHWEYSTETIIY